LGAEDKKGVGFHAPDLRSTRKGYAISNRDRKGLVIWTREGRGVDLGGGERRETFRGRRVPFLRT